ncbi:unnamed protein product [Heterobilharzia americana]|nr:unnamed protein product [Heterobilharzia americana]
MCDPNTSVKLEVQKSPNHSDVNGDALLDIFSFTQQTQPMFDSFDSGCLFVPVEGMERNTSPDDFAKRPAASKSKRSVSKFLKKPKGTKGAACLPPLPPVLRTALVVHDKPESVSNNSAPLSISAALKRAHDPPYGDEVSRKHCRRESNCSVLSSQGLVTKTHEVVCHVQPSENLPITSKIDDSLLKQQVDENVKVVSCEDLPVTSVPYSLKKRSHSFGGSLNRAASAVAGRRLLQKYRNTPHRLSAVRNRLSGKSPGWSRWRQMCRELRRRSSSLRITFHRSSSLVGKGETRVSSKSGKERIEEPARRSSSLSSRIGFPLPKWRHTFSRSKRRVIEQNVHNPLSFEMPADGSDTSLNTVHGASVVLRKSEDDCGMASGFKRLSCPKENCHFIMPLRRLLSRDYFHSKSLHSRLRSSLRHNEVTSYSPIIQVKSPHGYSANKCDLDSPEPRMQLDGSYVSDLSYSAVGSHCDVYCQPIHCSACGETLVLHTDITNANVLSPASHVGSELLLRPPASDRCSISSSYWQAEDPGDTIFTDAHLDALVEANRRYVSESHGGSPPKRSVSSLPANFYGSSFETNWKSDGTDRCQLGPSTKVSRRVTAPSPPGVLIEPVSSDGLCCSLTNNEVQGIPDKTPLLEDSNLENTGSLTNAQNSDLFEFPEQSNLSTFQGSSSEFMQTVDRERLRHECEELEAVVAALQKQLEAQADELSPESAAELLKLACTEPLNDIPTSVTSFTTGFSKQRCSKHRKIQFDDKLMVRPMSPKMSQIPETCALETGDIIPSSQTEDEPENCNMNQEHPLSTSKSAISTLKPSEQLSQDGWRKPASPPNSSLCDVIPGSLPLSSQTVRDPISPTQMQLSNITHCPETNLSSYNTQVDENWSTMVSDKCRLNIAVTGSNLSPSDAALLYKFCLQFNVLEHTRFIPLKTTHVVIKEEAFIFNKNFHLLSYKIYNLGRPRVVKRTLKYFMGILNRAWVVNTGWIRECIASKRLVDEGPYEIEGDTVCGDCHEGPRRGRLGVPAIPQSLDRLTFRNPANQLNDASQSDRRPFSDLWLCAYRNLGALQLVDFCQLASDGGAVRVFEKPEDLMNATNKVMQSMDITGTTVRKPRAIILTDKDSPDFNIEDCQELYRMYGVPVISIEWMLNCISLYRRLPINQVYRICPTPQPVSVSIPKS